MYRPNFCSECGVKILRLHWHAWSSRRFCKDCARGLCKERLKVPIIGAATLLVIGLMAGRATRPSPPPLIIERNSVLPENSESSDEAGAVKSTVQPGQTTNPAEAEEVVYICGARTKKGTPCSRRMHSPVRCWQHKGMPAMLPQEKLIVKG